MVNDLWPAPGSTFDSAEDALLTFQLAALVEGYGDIVLQRDSPPSYGALPNHTYQSVRCYSKRILLSADGKKRRIHDCRTRLGGFAEDPSKKEVKLLSGPVKKEGAHHAKHPRFGQPIETGAGGPLKLEAGMIVFGYTQLNMLEARLRADARRCGAYLWCRRQDGGYYYSCALRRKKCELVIRLQLFGVGGKHGEGEVWEVTEIKAPKYLKCPGRVEAPSEDLKQRLDCFPPFEYVEGCTATPAKEPLLKNYYTPVEKPNRSFKRARVSQTSSNTPAAPSPEGQKKEKAPQKLQIDRHTPTENSSDDSSDDSFYASDFSMLIIKPPSPLPALAFTSPQAILASSQPKGSTSRLPPSSSASSNVNDVRIMAGSDASDGESSDNESDDESNTSEEVVSPVEKREKVDCGKWEGKKKEMVSEIERRVKLEELDDDPNDLDDGLDAGVWSFGMLAAGKRGSAPRSPTRHVRASSSTAKPTIDPPARRPAARPRAPFPFIEPSTSNKPIVNPSRPRLSSTLSCSSSHDDNNHSPAPSPAPIPAINPKHQRHLIRRAHRQRLRKFFRTITHGNAYDEQQLLRSYYAHESSPVQLLRRARFDPEVIVEMYRDDRWEAGRMLRDVVGLKAGVEEVLGRRVGALLREEGGRKRIKQEFEGGRSAK